MHIFLQTNSQPISLKPVASMTFSFPLPIPVSIRLSLIGHWQYSWTYDRFLPVIRSVRLGWLCTRMARPPTMGVPARNTAVPSASPKPVFALVTTKTGTTARRTRAARDTRPFQTITDFSLTAAVSISSGLTPCGRSVSVTIPASNPQGTAVGAQRRQRGESQHIGLYPRFGSGAGRRFVRLSLLPRIQIIPARRLKCPLIRFFRSVFHRTWFLCAFSLFALLF